MKHVPTRTRTYGFQLSRTDVAVLIVAAVSAICLWPIDQRLASLILIVVGHFFLFCNVVRLRRNRELLWAGIFVVNAAWWWGLYSDARAWPVLLTQLPVTLVLVGLEMRNPCYRGIGARRLNPHLEEALKWP